MCLFYEQGQFIPAAVIHLRQDFWSMRGQMTYMARGPRRRFRVNKQRVKVIPVAIGTSRHACVLGEPWSEEETDIKGPLGTEQSQIKKKRLQGIN